MALRKTRIILALYMILLVSVNAMASTWQAVQQIKGKVVDKTGESIIGANVLIKGTTIGTITNIDGEFQLDANIGSTLVVTFLGYVPQEVKIENKQPLRIELTENAEVLDEVVVVGYGTQKKISSIGAQSNIRTETTCRSSF